MLFLLSPTLSCIHSLLPQHIYSVVLCCVSEDKAGVLLYNEFCIHVYEMVKSAKGGMFIIVFIIRSYVPGKGRGTNGYSFEWKHRLESQIYCSCEQLPGILDLYAGEHLLIPLTFLLITVYWCHAEEKDI